MKEMPLIARTEQTSEQSSEKTVRAARAPGAARARHTVLSTLAVLAVAGPAVGCAATSSASAAAPTGAASSRPAGTSSGTAGTGSTPSAASSERSSPATVSPVSASSCPGSAATAAAPASSGQDPALAAVQFVDPSHGWVAGAGRILATSDGGGTWTRQYTGSADLDQVDFTDSEHGWAAGGHTLLRTTDGGATWTPLAEPCRGELNSVHFVSATLGYAVAAAPGDAAGGVPFSSAIGGSLLRTTDGGVSWTPVSSAPANPQSACFADANDGYLGTPGHIWRTTDGGQSWTLALTEPGPSSNPKTADTPEIECAGPSALWVLFLGQGAAMSHAPYLAYASQDGHEWHGLFEEQYTESALRPSLKLPDGPGSYPGPFSAIGPDTAAFVGYTPPLGYGAAPLEMASSSGGTPALTQEGNVAAINEPFGVAFLSPTQGWVVGENLQTDAFSVEATSNAGRTWTTQYTTR
jgi:hypothetical protein